MQPPDSPPPGDPNPPTPPVPPTPPSAPQVPPQPPGMSEIPDVFQRSGSPPPPPPEPAAGVPPPPPPTGAEPTSAAPTPTFNCSFLPAPVFAPEPSKDEKMWAMILHLGGALGYLTAYVGLPGGNIVVPLIIWLIKKDASPFISDQGKEVLNFQLCMLIVTIVCIVTCVGIVLLAPLGIAALILGIIGGLKANEGRTYRYPLNLRMIK